MLLIFGITEKRKEIDFSQFHVCNVCGSYGNYEVFQTYSAFSLFFIPIIKWNKKYYARTTCCGSLYLLDKYAGKDIENGIKKEISQSDITPLNVNYRRDKKCRSCGYMVDPDYDYCPKCGNPM